MNTQTPPTTTVSPALSPEEFDEIDAPADDDESADDGGEDEPPARWFTVQGQLHDGRRLPPVTIAIWTPAFAPCPRP